MSLFVLFLWLCIGQLRVLYVTCTIVTNLLFTLFVYFLVFWFSWIHNAMPESLFPLKKQNLLIYPPVISDCEYTLILRIEKKIYIFYYSGLKLIV